MVAAACVAACVAAVSTLHYIALHYITLHYITLESSLVDPLQPAYCEAIKQAAAAPAASGAIPFESTGVTASRQHQQM
jgi:hypothetical protein